VICVFRKTLQGVGMLSTLLALGNGVDAVAAPILTCHLRQSDTVTDIQVAPTSDPYSVAAMQVNRFRFKAVVVGDANRVEYIKLYTYYETGKAAAPGGAEDVDLLHMARYLAPLPRSSTEADSLTGTVYLYEPRLGREFSYDCALRETAA
jgi:hypothetical protein